MTLARSFYPGNPSCPRCGGQDTVALDEPWWECATRVLREVVPEHVAGRPVPIYGRCGHRFDVEALAAGREAERRQKEEQEQEGERRLARAEETAHRLAELRTPDKILSLLADAGEVGELVPVASLKSAWVRAVSVLGAFGTEEIVTMHGQRNALGVPQRYLFGGTEWGSWQEHERLSAAGASWQEMSSLPGFETPQRRLALQLARPGDRGRLCVDLVLDSAGVLWQVESRNYTAYVNTMRGGPLSRSLIVPAGEKVEVRRRRRHKLWFTEFRNAVSVSVFEADDSLYCPAMRVALSNLDRR